MRMAHSAPALSLWITRLRSLMRPSKELMPDNALMHKMNSVTGPAHLCTCLESRPRSPTPLSDCLGACTTHTIICNLTVARIGANTLDKVRHQMICDGRITVEDLAIPGVPSQRHNAPNMSWSQLNLKRTAAILGGVLRASANI